MKILCIHSDISSELLESTCSCWHAFYFCYCRLKHRLFLVAKALVIPVTSTTMKRKPCVYQVLRNVRKNLQTSRTKTTTKVLCCHLKQWVPSFFFPFVISKYRFSMKDKYLRARIWNIRRRVLNFYCHCIVGCFYAFL